jgi:ATP-dependent Clp protease protease subunit
MQQTRLRMSHNPDDNEPGQMPGFLADQVLQTRTVLMFGEVTAALAQSVSQQVLLLAARSQADIKLLISAQGGPAEVGEALFDVLRGVGARVLVIGAGAVANAAALAFAAPPMPQRFCLPHARFALDQRLGGVAETSRDPLGGAAAVAAQRERLNALFARQTGQALDNVARYTERPTWLSAEEAQAFGLVGRVIQSANDI